MKTVLQNNIIDHISNTSTLPPDKSSHQRLHIFSSIVGSARDFELDNYAADCRRRSKLKTTPKKNINTTDRILCTTPLLPPDRLSYLLWCKSYLGEILMTLGLSLIELNHGTDDCQERVKSEATPIKCGYHHDMVVALLTRSFTESDHDIIMADEDGDWNSESWTVSTATARTQNQDLEQNLAENLHLDVSELMKTRLAARAKLLLQKGMHPAAEVPTGRQTHAAYSRSTGVSYDASTVNSEQTNTFTENPQKKYDTAKLKLAENTAELATKDREKEVQKKLIAKLLRQVGKHDENDILSDVDSAESDSSSDDDDESSDDDSSTSTSDKDDNSKGYTNASDSQMDMSNAEEDSPRQDPPAHSTTDDESTQES